MTARVDAAKALLASDPAARGKSFQLFVEGEVGLFEGVLAIAGDEATFVRDRFGSLEIEQSLSLAGATSVERREALFGEEVGWASGPSRHRVARLSRVDADALVARLGGSVPAKLAATTAVPVVAAAIAPIPAIEPVHVANTVRTAPSVVVASAVRRAPDVVVGQVASVGTAPANPRLASQRAAVDPDLAASFGPIAFHALVAGVIAARLEPRTYVYAVGEFSHRMAFWIVLALSLPLAELLLKLPAAKFPNAKWLRSPFPPEPEPLAGRFTRHAIAGSFAGFVSTFLALVVAPQIGGSVAFAYLPYAALGIALTWPKDRYPWLESAAVVTFGAYIGNQFSTTFYGGGGFGLADRAVDISIAMVWLIHTPYMRIRTRLPKAPPPGPKGKS